jgi:spore coat protein U-like protein
MMKTKILAASLVVAAGLSFNAMADTATLTVNASVVGVCKFQAAGATLTILQAGNPIDPSVPTAASGSTTIDYKCTKGQTPAFSAGNGSNFAGGGRHVSNGIDSMLYSLTLTPPAGTAAGFAAAAQQLAISGGIAIADFQAVSAGAYTDSVTLTVTP